MIMSLDCMDCLADLRGHCPRDRDALLVHLLHLFFLFPFPDLHRDRHWNAYMRSSANDELLDTASCASSNGGET